MEIIPIYSIDLIEKLKDKYKEKCPDFKENEREIFYYKGKVDLVKELILMYDDLNNKELEEVNFINKKRN